MLLRLQKRKKLQQSHQRRQKFRYDLSVFLLADKEGKAARDVCLELGNSQQPETLLFKCKRNAKKKTNLRVDSTFIKI